MDWHDPWINERHDEKGRVRRFAGLCDFEGGKPLVGGVRAVRKIILADDLQPGGTAVVCDR